MNIFNKLVDVLKFTAAVKQPASGECETSVKLVKIYAACKTCAQQL